MIISPNMNLPISTIAVDSGLQWEQNLNSALTLIDNHDHSPGKGVPINSNSINITSDLTLNTNNLVGIRSLRFVPQLSALSGPLDLGCLYETGVDLWYNDGNGNQVQITSGGVVNATSSGISSGSATASFVSSVLVVNRASNTPANIQVGSVLLGNNVSGSKFLTLSPPNAMPANYTLVLPSLPPAQQIMTLDNFGNISAPYTVDNSTITITSNVIGVPNSGIGTAQLADNSVTPIKLSPANFAISSPVNGTLTANGNTVFTASLTTTASRPVKISLQADSGQASNVIYTSGSILLNVNRGVTTLCAWRLDGGLQGIAEASSAYSFTDYSNPGGSNTYTVTDANGGQYTLNHVVMTVQEQ